MAEKTDLYATLGVARNATFQVIRRAYRHLARQYHPDRNNGSVDDFHRVQQAWDVLGDPERRRRYDETGYGEVRADNDMAPVIAVLSSAMCEVINELLENDREPMREDVTALLAIWIARRREQVTRMMLDVEKGVIALRSLRGRFTTKSDTEGNVLEEVAAGHLARANAQMTAIETELGQIEKAREFLKKYGFNPVPLFGDDCEAEEPITGIQVELGQTPTNVKR